MPVVFVWFGREETMSKLLEILGRAITVNITDLIWHWLNATTEKQQNANNILLSDFGQIVEHLGNFELKIAEEKLRFYLFENPDCAYGRMAAAAIYLHGNHIQEAIEQLQSIYLRQPSNTMALYALGHCHEQLGNEAQAIEFYQDCIKFKNYLKLPRQRMAAIYFKNGRIDKTIHEYKLLISEHPEDISSFVLLGFLYIKDKQYEQAIDTFNTAIVTHPDNFSDDGQDIHLNSLIESGQFDTAIESIQALIEKVGEASDLYVRMGDILSKASRGPEAIIYYEKALHIQPNYLEATIKLGTHYLRLQRHIMAAEQFNRGVEINDEIVDSYIGLVIAQDLAGQKQEALKTLSLASAIQQNSTLLFSEMSTLHFYATMNENSGTEVKLQDSSHLIGEVIQSHQAQMLSTPKSADIHYKYGILMMITGNLPRAIDSFQNALKINPTHYRARCKLAICLYDKGDRETAMDSLTEDDSFDYNMLDLHYKTAILYCNNRKFSAAINKLENVMKENFTQPDATVNIEVVLENLGLIDRATITWDRLTEAVHHAISTKHK